MPKPWALQSAGVTLDTTVVDEDGGRVMITETATLLPADGRSGQGAAVWATTELGRSLTAAGSNDFSGGGTATGRLQACRLWCSAR